MTTRDRVFITVFSLTVGSLPLFFAVVSFDVHDLGHAVSWWLAGAVVVAAPLSVAAWRGNRRDPT